MKRWLVLLSCFILSACSAEKSDLKALKVGMELSYPPFEMTNENGRPAGISVEIATALADKLGRTLQIENIPFDGLIPALKTGKIDLIISSMTATQERAQSIDFSDPYLRTGLCLLVRKASPIQSIDDLTSGTTVAVKKGTTGHQYAATHLTNLKVLDLDKESMGVLEVTQGKADAFIYDQMSTYIHWKKNPETTRAILKPFQAETWAIGIRKGNDELRQDVNRFLEEYRKRGGFEELGSKYLSEQKREFQKLGYPFYF